MPAHASTRRIKSERGIQDIFLPLFSLHIPWGSSVPKTGRKQQAPVPLQGTPLFYMRKSFLITASIHYYSQVLAACAGLILGSCQAPTQPLSAFLSSTRGENTIKKLMGQGKNREITKPVYLLARFSSDTLCHKPDISVMRARDQMTEMVVDCSPRDSQNIGIVGN